MEAYPKYIKDVIAVLGLEDSKPLSTPSVKRTPTTESQETPTPNVQEHSRWSRTVEKHDSFCLVKNTTVSELEFCRSRVLRSDNWNFGRDADKISLERTGIRSDTREPCRQSICEGMGIQTRLVWDG